MSQTRLRTNFTFNIVGALLPLAVALVTVPIYISYIGAARYGILSIIWLLFGYFGFLDFGLSRAATNFLAKHHDAPKDRRAEIFMTSLCINLVFGIIGGITLFFSGSFLLNHFLPISPSLRQEIATAFPWIACMLPLALLGGVARGAIESKEQFFAVNILDLIGAIVNQILPITCAILISPSLAVVIAAALFSRALSVILTVGYVFRSEQFVTLRVFNHLQFKELVTFGAWVSVTNVVGPLLTSADQLLVGSTLGAAAVTHYVVSMNLVLRGQVFANALARTLFPRFSRLARPEALRLAQETALSLSYGFGAICGPAIIISRPFMSLWMGSNFSAIATPVLEILLLGAWINGVAFIPFAFLQGQGRPDLVAKLHVFEFPPFIATLWLLLQHFGLPGAALAWSGRVAVDATLLFAAAQFRLSNLLRAIPALILMLASYRVTQISEFSVLTSGLVAGLIFAAFGGCAIVFDMTSRRLFLAVRARLLEIAQ